MNSNEVNNIEASINKMVEKANVALKEYMKLNQQDVDRIVKNMAFAAMKNHIMLAKMAVEETGRGILEDKIIKNMFASEYVWNFIKNKKTVGIIKRNEAEEYIEIADPLGVVAGVTPVTNPTSTTIFKSLICAKTRNPIIFGFHPGAQKSCVKTAEILKEAAIEAGAPKDLIQWIEKPSIEATSILMNHPGVDIVLATGGSAMVKSAYSTGKPALGVGPGNVPCYIEKTADILRAATDLILSKTFDNGMICASEQSVIVDDSVSKEFERIMTQNGCIFLNEEEAQQLLDVVVDPHKKKLNPKIVGKSAYEIAKLAEINVPKSAKILIVGLKGVGEEFPLSQEKLSPILSYYKSKSVDEAFKICKEVINFSGNGHTAVIHSKNEEIIKKFGLEMDAGRIVVNSPSSHGAIGDIYNSNIPSLTLGCGSHGKNSISSNISCAHLINIKTIYKRRVNMQWFKVPPEVYFEKNSISCLKSMKGINRVLIVTDRTMIELSNLDKVLYYINQRSEKCMVEIFSDVNPDPNIQTVSKGLEIIKKFNPDSIIALGGGSVIDAAKGMWIFSGEKEMDFENLRLKFMNIEKRICEFPKSHKKIKLIAIPTTSGTGSEVTSFAVISDNLNGKSIKYPLADYSLTPNVAIVDPQFVASLPKAVTADTGMDVLTHAIEAYVSTMANDYTDGLCLQAISMVFKYLRRAYENGSSDSIAREKMHNASCIAGMAFTNSFLGLNHSMAHKLGGEFGISHGRANAILLPYVIKYNSSLPSKFSTFPKYESFIADEKYALLSRLISKEGNTVQDGVNNLINSIIEMNKFLSIPLSLKDFGISEEEFLNKVDYLSELAHEDQCTLTNPRYPLISEIKEIYLKCFYGNL